MARSFSDYYRLSKKSLGKNLIKAIERGKNILRMNMAKQLILDLALMSHIRKFLMTIMVLLPRHL